MSWVEDAVTDLESLNPNALKLAEAVSPAIRIEPELLRAMRLELLPESDAGCEADLWFSNLVEERSLVGIVLDPEVATLLRGRLAADRERLTRAALVIAEVHRAVPKAVQLEEELTYLSLSGETDALREQLRSTVASLVDPQRPGLAAWAARAVERFPKPVRELEETQMLAAGARLRVGEDAAPNIDVPPERLMEWIEWLAPRTADTLSIGVAMVERGIEIGNIRGNDVHLIEVPAIRPILLEVTWREESEHRSETVSLRPDDVVFVEGPVEFVDLRTAHGDRYHLRRTHQTHHKFIARNRAPRVQIEYDVELYGAEK